MRNRSKKYNIKQELRKIVYMLFMVFTIVLADVIVASATSDDEAAAEHILDNRQENENRTNINEPGTAQTACYTYYNMFFFAMRTSSPITCS